MSRLYLLRHGPTDAGLRGAPLGRMDLPVTEAGQALWPQVKEELLALGLQRVLTSDLLRARCHGQDMGLPCQVCPTLGEQAFGAWDGRPWATIQGAEAFFEDPVHVAPPGGESFAQCASRVLGGLSSELEDPLPTLILAHGGPLRALLSHLLGLPLERALDLAWQPFGLSRVDLYAGARGVLQFHNQGLPSAAGPGML